MGKIDRLREIELELLEHFINICEREHLKWYVSHGTLLGAIRESGFLLWDDDIDIVMPTADYNRLIAHRNWFQEPYYLQTPMDFARSTKLNLFKNGTTAFDRPLHEMLKKGGHLGICIDILPLDEIGNTGYYLLSGETVPMAYYEPSSKAKFENLEVSIPGKARKVLECLYGYWNWPSGAELPKPHFWFFDTEIDYSIYLNRYMGWLKAAEGKAIYLFGASDSLKIWLEDFGMKKQVICTFDNDSSKWGTDAYGIPITNPIKLKDLLDENSILIIVSIWHQEIGRQLEKMGISEYYVFLDGLLTSGLKGRKNG